MSQLILMTGVSVLLFGTCSPPIDQDARQANFRQVRVERQTRQADAAAAKQAARQQAHEAHLADIAEETRQCVLRMEKLLSDREARVKAYGKQVDSPEKEVRYAEMSQKLDEARSRLVRIRATWRRMSEELTPPKQG